MARPDLSSSAPLVSVLARAVRSNTGMWAVGAALMALVTIPYVSASQPPQASAFTLPTTFPPAPAAASVAPFAGTWTDGRVRLVLVPRPCGLPEGCVFG